MDRGDGDDAGDGDYEAAVLLDAFYVAFAALEGAFGDADFLAGVVFGGVGAEDFEGVGAGAGDEDEGAHLIFGDGGRDVHLGGLAVYGAGALLLAGVDGELLLIALAFAVELCELLFCAADEQQGTDQRLAVRGQGAVGVAAGSGEFVSQREDFVVEHLQRVPVRLFRHRVFFMFFSGRKDAAYFYKKQI